MNEGLEVYSLVNSNANCLFMGLSHRKAALPIAIARHRQVLTSVGGSGNRNSNSTPLGWRWPGQASTPVGWADVARPLP